MRTFVCKFALATGPTDHTPTDWCTRVTDLTLNGFEVSSPGEGPVPWDTNIYVFRDAVMLDGHVGPNGFGTCKVSVPQGRFDHMYRVEVTSRFVGTSERELIELLNSMGIQVLVEDV